MKFSLIIIAILLMVAVGFSWVPSANTAHNEALDMIDTVNDPVQYDTIPVEHIEFDEPVYINVDLAALQYEAYKSSQIN